MHAFLFLALQALEFRSYVIPVLLSLAVRWTKENTESTTRM